MTERFSESENPAERAAERVVELVDVGAVESAVVGEVPPGWMSKAADVQRPPPDDFVNPGSRTAFST